MDLIVLPDDGLDAVLKSIDSARTSLDLIIFRFDLKRVEKAVEEAVRRGVATRALVAHTNSGGEKRLRQLEQRMLQAGVIVSRTADDLVRYHGKMLIVDREELHVYGFNYTALDLKSRSFGLVSRDRRCVQEALRLFDADAAKQDFSTTLDQFVVSPENARERLGAFISEAKRQLLVWDPRVSDPQMIRLMQERARAGVDVRVLGKIGKRGAGLRAAKFPGKRLHVRAMVRDGDAAFVGSQSLRALELDARREVGLITKDGKVVKRLCDIFEEDWAKTDLAAKEQKELEKQGELAVAES